MKKVKFLSSVLMFGAIVLLFNRCTNTDDLIKPGDGNQPIVVETNIYGEDFGTTAVQTGTAWPAVAAYDGYSKLGIGAGAVTYSAEGGAVTVRANSNSSGYSGASGSCNAMMAASGGALVINDIATCGATNLKLSFGSNETNDVIAVSYKINGTTNWVAIPYTKTNSAWGLVENLSITLPTGANTIKLKFTAGTTQYGARVDDVKITTTDATGAAIVDTDNGGTTNPQGDGTQANPYNVAYAVANQSSQTAWVRGYIVGCVKNGVSTVSSASDILFSSGWDSQTNVLIADSPTETDYHNCIAVNLPSGKPLRTDVNLVTHPENYKKTLAVTGVLRTYFGMAGLRDSGGEATDFVLSGQGSGGGGTTEAILNETLLTQASFNKFTAVNVSGTQEWTFSTTGYGATMSGYDNATATSNANEDWFISPAIDLTGKTAVLTFDHARGPAGSMSVATSNYTLWVSTNYASGAPATATWTQLTIPTHGTTAWAYVSSGNISLPSAANVRFAFKYVCNNTESATWEIKNILVN